MEDLRYGKNSKKKNRLINECYFTKFWFNRMLYPFLAETLFFMGKDTLYCKEIFGFPEYSINTQSLSGRIGNRSSS